MISLSPSYTSNPYILASNLADIERWPELAVPSSPAPSDDENERGLNDHSLRGAAPQKSGGLANLDHHRGRNGQDGATEGNRGRGRPTGFPGATGLKYTTTIMGGNRTGAVGLRVSGSGDKKTTDVRKAARRASARFDGRRKRLSNGMGVGRKLEEASVLEASDEDREGARSDGSKGSKVATVDVNIVGPSDGGATSAIPKFTPPLPDSREVTNPPNQNLATINSSPPYHRHSSSQDQTQTAGGLTKPTTGAVTATPPKIVGFIPNFKGAAEMEARRRHRLQARGRGGPGGFGMGTRGGAQPAQPLSLRDIDTSSSSEPEPPSDVEGDKAQTSDEDISGNNPADTDSDGSAAGEDSAEEDGFDIPPVIDGSMDLAHEFDPYVFLYTFHFRLRVLFISFYTRIRGFTYVAFSLFGLGSFLQRVEVSISEADRMSPQCYRCLIHSCRLRMGLCRIPLEYLLEGEGLDSALLRNIGSRMPGATAPRLTVIGTDPGLVVGILHRLSLVLTTPITLTITTNTVPEEVQGIIPVQVLDITIPPLTIHPQDRSLTS